MYGQAEVSLLDAQQIQRMRERYCDDRRMHADFLKAFRRDDNFRYQYIGRVNQMRCAIDALARLSARVCALAPPPKPAANADAAPAPADAQAWREARAAPPNTAVLSADDAAQEQQLGRPESLFGAAMAQLRVLRRQPTPELARRAFESFLRDVGIGGVRGGRGGASVPRRAAPGAVWLSRPDAALRIHR
jgi:hypothetical protein